MFWGRPLIRIVIRVYYCMAFSRVLLSLSGLLVVLQLAFVTIRSVVAQEEAVQTKAQLSLGDLKSYGALNSKWLRPSTQAQNISQAPKQDLATFQNVVRPLLESTCSDCHSQDLQEGNFRVDQLDPDLVSGDDVSWWMEVLKVITNDEMPPEGEGELNDEHRSQIIEWLSREIQVASKLRRNKAGHSSFRRLTRYEYNFALQDLLGLPFDFATDLPPDPITEEGFQNSAEVLQMSASQFATYHELGRSALRRATVRGPQPKPVYWAIPMDKAITKQKQAYQAEVEKRRKRWADDPERLEVELERLAKQQSASPSGPHYRDLESGLAFRAKWNYRGAKFAWDSQDSPPDDLPLQPCVAVIPPRQKLIVELGNRIPDRGVLRVRIRAGKFDDKKNGIPCLRLELGFQASNNSAATQEIPLPGLEVHASHDAPEFYQFDIPLSEIRLRNPMRRTAKMGDTPNPSEFLKLYNASAHATVQIDYMEVEGPVYETWPPNSHKRLFGMSTEGLHEPDAARPILQQFIKRAWRRSPSVKEVDQKIAIFQAIRSNCENFEEAIIEVFASVLASPNFLYLKQNVSAEEGEVSDPKDRLGQRLNHTDFATRLSTFLWSSIPDDELRELAETGELENSEVLMRQVSRMLKDERSQRFSRNFVRQWLGMQPLDHLRVDTKKFPFFEHLLLESMQEEPIAFFQETLDNNHSVIDFIHSDFAMMNERLALHYGEPGIFGPKFRRVPVDNPDRGGLLGQAGLLAMNSDGTDSHPLKRGIWLLSNLLNDPPPPPPPAVPEIDLADPEIAKLSLKERLEDHRNDPACYSCHAKIDPWGIAFENFDAVGKWRTKIGEDPVDATSVLFNKQQLEGMEGLKRFLLRNRQDQFVEAYGCQNANLCDWQTFSI